MELKGKIRILNISSLANSKTNAQWHGYCASGTIFDEKIGEVRYLTVNLALR